MEVRILISRRTILIRIIMTWKRQKFKKFHEMYPIRKTENMYKTHSLFQITTISNHKINKNKINRAENSSMTRHHKRKTNNNLSLKNNNSHHVRKFKRKEIKKDRITINNFFQAPKIIRVVRPRKVNIWQKKNSQENRVPKWTIRL